MIVSYSFIFHPLILLYYSDFQFFEFGNSQICNYKIETVN